MPFFDVKDRIMTALMEAGYPCDPVVYIGAHAATAGPTSTLTFKPYGARGWFLATGITGAPQGSATLALTFVTLANDARPITEAPIVSPLLLHGNANSGTFNATGIDTSQWPAPVVMEPASSLNLTEQCASQVDTMANVRRSLNGVHTSKEGALYIAKLGGELRCFGFPVTPTATVDNGVASNQWTFLNTMRIVEWAVVNQDAAPAALDYARGKIDEDDILVATRVGNNVAGAGVPMRLGIPTSYLGRRVKAGQTLNIEERVSATTRNDFWGALCIAPVEY